MSSKKLFSLISGESVHLAPGTKVLDAESVQCVHDCQGILEKVKADAVEYKKQLAEECEKERDQAQKEGFELGMQKWVAHLAELEKKISQAREEVLKIVVPVTIKAAQKIVGRELAESKETIVDIVANNLKAVAGHRNITIYVNPGQLEFLQSKREKFKEVFERLESLAIQPREDISENSCVIETEAGIISAELENQWRHLEAAIEEMVGALK